MSGARATRLVIIFIIIIITYKFKKICHQSNLYTIYY